MREFKGDWRDLFFGFRIALDLRKMFLGLLGMVFSFAGIALIMFFGALPSEQLVRVDGILMAPDQFAQLEKARSTSRIKGEEVNLLELIKEKEFDAAFFLVTGWVESNYLAPASRCMANPGKLALFPSTEDAKTRIWPWLVMGGAVLWLIFIWSKFGGAISRIAAVEIAKDERITIHESLDFAKKKFTSYFWSTVAVAVAFLFFFFVNVLGGLVGAIPYAGPVLVAILCPFAFLGGFVMLLIAIGGFFGWPLMSPAIAAEGTDAFDAVSRAFSYIYTKPWQYFFYWLVAAVYGAFSIGFVWLFTLVMVRLSIGSAHVGMGKSLNPVIDSLFNIGTHGPESAFSGLSIPQGILFVILGTVIMVIYGLASAYSVSYCYSARSLMYFILRKKVDSTEMNEVFMEEEEEDDFFSEDTVLPGGDKPGKEAGEKQPECQDAGADKPKEPPKPMTDTDSLPTSGAEEPKAANGGSPGAGGTESSQKGI